MTGDLLTVYERLRARSSPTAGSDFLVPGILTERGGFGYVSVGDPYTYLANVLEGILARGQRPAARELDENSVVYLAFPRTFASLDRRAGTALTQIAFLPFLRDELGISFYITLPNGEIGMTNRKGTRGSPFAVRNPFAVDCSLADPLIPEVDALTQHRALVQACELLGIVPGSVVPLATLAVDSPLFLELPELGYWWLAEPGELAFVAAGHAGESSERPELPEIPNDTLARFLTPPARSAIRRMEAGGAWHFCATSSGHPQRLITLANAFPDVVAGASDTYTWSDVASIRYVQGDAPRPSGTSIDPGAQDQRLPAWAIMPAIPAWRHRELGERVFLIDVSPSVPAGVIRASRSLMSEWSPSFDTRLSRAGAGLASSHEVEQLLIDLRNCIHRGSDRSDAIFVAEELWDFDARDAQYAAVYGPMIFSVGANAHNRSILADALKEHLLRLEERGFDNFFFAGASNHDTAPPPPAVIPKLAAAFAFLPQAIPLIYSGSEWGSTDVTNKEFGFSSTAAMAIDDAKLGLFNELPLDWDALGSEVSTREVFGPLARLFRLRRAIGSLHEWSYATVFPDPFRLPECFGYTRTGPASQRLIVLMNWSTRPARFIWGLGDAVPLFRLPESADSSGPVRPGKLFVAPPESLLVAGTDTLQARTAL